MSYQINWENRGCAIRFSGKVSDDTVLAAIEEMQGNESFDNLRYIVVDHSCCTNFSVTPDCLEFVIATNAASALSNNLIKVAIVANDPAVEAAAERFASSPITVFQTRTFRRLESAYQWLGMRAA